MKKIMCFAVLTLCAIIVPASQALADPYCPSCTSSVEPSTTSVKPTTTSSVILSTTTSVQPTTTSSIMTSTTTSSQLTTTSSTIVVTTTSVVTTSSVSTTTTVVTPCAIEIALGRSCPGEEIDDPAYNRPGRRGLAATCGDVIDFTVCSDCVPFDPACLVWSIEPAAAFLSISKIDTCCWRLTVGDACSQLDKIEEYEVTVTDTCNRTSDSVMVEVGKVIIDIGDTTIQPNTESAGVDIDLINPAHHIRAVAMDICECEGGDDSLVCTECRVDENRARSFTCSASERADGCCRVVLYSTDPAAVIAQGRGKVAEVVYEAGDAEVGECICLRPENRQVSDEFNENICTCGSPGEVCFRTCGDVYPQDCLGGPCADTSCGDGVVDLFDILEAVDIILGLQTATDCQVGNGDVPNGKPPYCGNPSGTPNCDTDGEIDLFDLLVIIDKAVGIMNCCDYCLFGEIY